MDRGIHTKHSRTTDTDGVPGHRRRRHNNNVARCLFTSPENVSVPETAQEY